MRDWTGTTVQHNALTIMCPYCKAPIGEPCTNEVTGERLHRFPAHTTRITATTNTEGTTHE